MHSENEDYKNEYDRNFLAEEDPVIPEPGPLSIMPSLHYIHPAMLMYIIFIIISVLYWQTPIKDMLWVSGESLFQQGQFWRVITSICAHADAVHLLSNSLLFFVFGWLMHAYFGWKLFPVAALFGGVSASVMTVYVYEPTVRLLGASGMVYSMVGLWLVFYVRYDTNHRVVVRFMRSMGFSLIMMFPTAYNPTTSYLAHASGFIAGIITGLIMMKYVKPRKNMIPMKRIEDNAL